MSYFRQNLSGLLSARPPAGVPNRFYFATDTGLVYSDDGSTWNTVTAATTTLYIPDPYEWAATGVTAPVRQGPVWRVGSTLYIFGGTTGTATNKIYTGTWGSSAPTFVDSGLTLPANVIGGKVFLLGSTFYMFGDNPNGSTFIYSASLSNPLSWSNTGSSLPATRAHPAYALVGTTIMLVGGYSGSAGYQTAAYAQVATPTTWSTTGTSINTTPGGNWQCSGCVIDGNFLSIGGFGNITTVHKRKASSMSPTPVPMAKTACLSTGIDTSPDIFHTGDSIVVLGCNNADVVVGQVRRELAFAWENLTGILPATQQYPYRSSWIGSDGRIYYINYSTGAIVQSGRRAVTVKVSDIAAASAYGSLPGVFDDGTPTTVSPHVRMANPPWLTDKVTAY